jgi:hypothetical protein
LGCFGLIIYAPPHGERLSPDLLRGSGKSIVGDLDVDDEGSEQNVKPLYSLYHCFVGYQSMRHELTFAKKANPYKCNREHTSKNEEDAI